jgi:tRNA-binding protein
MSNVSFKEFKKMDIRVIKVLKAEPVPKKRKIYKLTVDIGSCGKRTMIVGGAEFYKTEDFEGGKFIALVNLAPKKIANVDSKGMLLAADVDGRPVWLTTAGDAPVGSKVI